MNQELSRPDTRDTAGRRTAPPAESSDPAGKSLAEALRVSFALLTVIMIIMVIGFLASGIKSVKSNQKGIVKVFGRVVRTTSSGLTYTWPWPIGQIELVSTAVQQMSLGDFWIHETLKDKNKSLDQRRAAAPGLRPGWDGAFLTGDRYLLHMKLDCTYKVTDPVSYAKRIGEEFPARYPGAGKDEKINPTREILRSVVCSAAIQAAATRTAQGLQLGEREQFTKQVTKRANQSLRETSCGLEITKLTIPLIVWPLKARGAYLAAQQASKKAEQRINNARSNAERILQKAAGESYETLVGRPWGSPEPQKNPAAAAGSENKGAGERGYDLIGKYIVLRQRADRDKDEEAHKQAEELLKEIDDVLANTATGDASQIIADARGYSEDIRQSIKGRVVRFTELLVEYRRAPEFFRERYWADVRDKVLTSPKVVKHFVALGDGKTKTIIRLDSDPEIARKIRMEKFREKTKARKAKVRQQYSVTPP